MGADDLMGRVALYAFRASIPTNDVPRGIQHEDSVVLHAFDQETEPLFTFLPLKMGGAVLFGHMGTVRIRTVGLWRTRPGCGTAKDNPGQARGLIWNHSERMGGGDPSQRHSFAWRFSWKPISMPRHVSHRRPDAAPR